MASLLTAGCLDKAGAPKASSSELRTGMPPGGCDRYLPKVIPVFGWFALVVSTGHLDRGKYRRER